MEVKTALLIIDLQNDYFEGGSFELVGSWEASLKAQQILEYFRKQSNPVVHIKHISLHPTATFFLPETKGVDIHANVYPAEGEKVIIKHSPNSFQNTELLHYLKENGVTNLVVSGMMTHMCLDATVRAAKDFGFECTVLADACATRDLEICGKIVKSDDVHHAFLAALSHYYALISTTEDYLLGEK